MRVRIDIALPGSEPLVQVLTVPDPDTADGIMGEALVRRRVAAIQRRYPSASVSWREVEEVKA